MARSSLHVHRHRPTPASGAVPLALGLAGSLVAVIGSWNVSLWTDEAATITSARRTLPELWGLVSHHDAVHALYYLFMHGWTSLFGFSAFALRFPSALVAGAAVVGVWALARAVGRADLAVLAGVIAIVLPRITWMGIEARSFGPSATVAVWATVLLLWALERGRWRWVVYAALIALGIALNIYLALLVVAHLATVALLPNLSWRRRAIWLVSAAIGSMVASPVILLAASQKGQLGDNALSITEMLRQAFVNQWFLGATPTRVTASDSGTSLWAIAAILLAVVGWIAMAIAVVVGIRAATGAKSRTPAVGAIVTVPWILLPTLITIGYSIAVSPLYNSRYFTFAAPAVALLMAIGIGALHRSAVRWGRLRIAVVAVVVVLAAPIYVSQRQSTGKSGTDWSQAAAYVASHAKTGDGVYFSPLEPSTDRAIGRTTRYMAVAYPDAFSGLRDVTLLTTGAQDDTLRGTSAQLSTRTARLGDLDAVWVVRPTTYPAGASASDDALLEAAGLREETRWTGPMDSVVEFSRR